ncbi:helix-turn-helix domain-containing protein [Bradyrhizobium sp. 38]|uniref:helix-turn-helix domain-containing protein n=1 Tax=unclassified Bradyrhizobium TaxID=2631580 RepID=UPI001FFB8DF6|nr:MULTISPECIES: helix-turn-helix domain-containing protein [unclassified Bradyrhizobium]MCK1335611.1 helix-turn-helix domain-containing protein [Bradyrhizobium sp. 38]MCK1778148.1 helix-turn-helix domain-containing protein [Bradyrhizobium sp. 132]
MTVRSFSEPVDPTDVSIVPDADADLQIDDRPAVPPITLAELEIFVRATVRDRAQAAGLNDNKAQARVDQAATALNRAGLKRDATLPARRALETSLKDLKQRKGTNNRKPLSQANLALDLLGELESARERQAQQLLRSPRQAVVVVPTFGSELKRYRKLAGYSQNGLAKKFGIHSSFISRWEAGMLPEDNEKRRALVMAIGKTIGCGGERLWNLGGDQLRVTDVWPEAVPEKMRRRVSKLAGNLRGLSSKKRCEARLSAWTKLQNEEEDGPKQKRYSLGFDIDAWPGLLAEDWKWHLRLVLTGEKLPPERTPIIELTEDEKKSRPVDPDTGLKIYASGVPLLEDTARKRTKDLSLILGSCVNLERPKEVRFEPQVGGSAKKSEVQVQPPPLTLDHLAQLGFSLLAFPALIEHHFAALRHRRGLQKAKNGKKKESKLTRDRSRYCGVLRGILHCLGQQPRYAERLVPIPALITEKDVRAARSDWKKFCEDASARYKTIYEGEKHRVSEPYDHAAEIEGILDDEESPDALFAIFEHHSGLLRSTPERNQRRARQLKKALAAGLKAQAFLRPGTEQRLNTNNLVCRVERGKAVWRLQGPKHYFKNHRSPAIKNGLNRKLVDLDGVFYDIIEEYLEWARGHLLAGVHTDALIVRTPSNPRFVGDKAFSDWWVEVSREAMAEDRPEYHGAKRLNSIQVRKIAATDSFRKTGKEDEAAKALGNTKRCAQIYIKVTAAALTESSSQRVADADAARRDKRKSLIALVAG